MAEQIPFDINALPLLAMFLNPCFPVNLSADVSINLQKIVRFEPVEKLDDKEKPSGEIVPAIIFDGDDVLFLTPDQLKVFRPIWNMYCQLANNFLSMAKQFAYPNQTAPTTANDQ